MKSYIRKINYYETDQMGVVHHSNYIRFFEEARCYFLECIGYPYNKLEEEKIASPVINVSCEYKKPVKYGDIVNIEVRIISISKVRATFEYKVYDTKTLELRAMGSSEHCFINETGRVISMEKYNPEFFNALLSEEEISFHVDDLRKKTK